MRIDGQNRTEIRPPQTPPEGAGLTRRPAGGASDPDAEAVDAKAIQASYVQQAAQTPEIDTQAVQQAKQLLKSGQLDTPDAIRRAAQNIAENGV